MLNLEDINTYVQLHTKLVARAENLLASLSEREIAVLDVHVVRDTYGLESKSGLNVLVYYTIDLESYPMKWNIPFPLELFLTDLETALGLVSTYKDSFLISTGDRALYSR